jgi:hypothetical protein
MLVRIEPLKSFIAARSLVSSIGTTTILTRRASLRTLMSTASLQAASFYREVAEHQVVWAIKDEGGFPAPFGDEQRRSMPFWSSQARARKVISSVPAYQGFAPVAITWSEFVERWVPGLTKDGLLVGVNWSGERATGYDIEADVVRKNVEAQHDSR